MNRRRFPQKARSANRDGWGKGQDLGRGYGRRLGGICCGGGLRWIIISAILDGDRLPDFSHVCIVTINGFDELDSNS